MAISNARNDVAQTQQDMKILESAGIDPAALDEASWKMIDQQGVEAYIQLAMNDGGDARMQRKMNGLSPAMGESSDPSDWRGEHMGFANSPRGAVTREIISGPRANENKRPRG